MAVSDLSPLIIRATCCASTCVVSLPLCTHTLQMFVGTYSTWKFSLPAYAELILLMGVSEEGKNLLFSCLKLVLS